MTIKTFQSSVHSLTVKVKMLVYSLWYGPITWLIGIATEIQFFWYEMIFKNQCLVDLQCCVNFCCPAKWFTCIYIFFHILFHYRLSQETGYSSLHYTEEPCCLSILCAISSLQHDILISGTLIFRLGCGKSLYASTAPVFRALC